MGKHIQKHLEGSKEVIISMVNVSSRRVHWRKSNFLEREDEFHRSRSPSTGTSGMRCRSFESDFVGSSELFDEGGNAIGIVGSTDIMLITECGTAERVLAESEHEINLLGSCVMCRHMKRTS